MVFSKSKSNYLVYCAHGNQALNAYGGHKAKAYNLENLRSILSVGEPLNAEAVIWGEENFGFYYWLVANGNGRYYDSQLSFNESKTRSMGKPLP
jgi:acyl-coenzyme A synthetase/AMP-(fatty) acid ligase